MMQLSILPPPATMYDALVRRDQAFEGLFVVGVKTTGIFCRPTCPARKPKPDSVEYFPAAREALLSGYRACLRCRPMEPAGAPPPWLRGLLAEIERTPDVKLSDAALEARGLEPARVRRWFQATHGMTFHAYQRARRLGTALGRIKQGAPLTDTAYDAGFESESGFREAFGKLFGAPPGRARAEAAPVAMVTRVATPLGPMVAAATEQKLLLLEFADRRMLEKQIQRIRGRLRARFVPGDNEILARTQAQLAEYFERRRKVFDLPLELGGSEFQQAVWQELLRIPYGTTRSYTQQAEAIGRIDALRAVARANGDNRLAIIVPCHRVIGASGELTGYGGQLWRKKALLDLERGG